MNTQRWYDKNYPEVSNALEIISTFPIDILTIVANGVVTIADKELKANELVRSYRSLGTEKVKALHKASGKRRTLDQVPQLHKTVTYLTLLSEENRRFLGVKMLELIAFVYDYIKTAKQFQCEVVTEEVGELTQVYIEEGSAEAKGLLFTLKQGFLDKLERKKESESLTSGSQDMRINKVED